MVVMHCNTWQDKFISLTEWTSTLKRRFGGDMGMVICALKKHQCRSLAKNL